ncbi:MAG: hypothetical protein GEV05_24395 [Betaproteobacteria bacterium]|nr:hypothetical protein [Betaproteobacteria bacterium]
MDPLTTATLFATIVSLIADFRSQSADDKQSTYEEFEAWLRESRHDDIVEMLRQNRSTAIGIKALLHQDRETLRQRFDQLDRSIAALASGMEGFSDLAQAIRPEARIAPQAIEFLRQFDASGANKVLQVDLPLDDRVMFTYLGRNGEIGFEDKRFIVDDVLSLVEMGLLRLEHNGSGGRIFCLTRNAADFVRALPEAAKQQS